MTQSPSPGSSTAYPTSGNEGSTGLVDQAQDKVGQLVDQAQHTAGQVTEEAKQQATSQLESQKERGVDSLVTVAQALRQTGQHLREQPPACVRRITRRRRGRRGGDFVHRVSHGNRKLRKPRVAESIVAGRYRAPNARITCNRRFHGPCLNVTKIHASPISSFPRQARPRML